MHELPVIKSILEICLKHAEKNDARKIIAIYLKVGEMSDLEPEWMQQYFDYLTKDTIAFGCKLKIEVVPTVLRCKSCGHDFEASIREEQSISCPECHSGEYHLQSEQKYYIDNMEVV